MTRRGIPSPFLLNTCSLSWKVAYENTTERQIVNSGLNPPRDRDDPGQRGGATASDGGDDRPV
jgi:hypothetical protein